MPEKKQNNTFDEIHQKMKEKGIKPAKPEKLPITDDGYHPIENLFPIYEDFINLPSWTEYQAAALLAHADPEELRARLSNSEDCYKTEGEYFELVIERDEECQKIQQIIIGAYKIGDLKIKERPDGIYIKPREVISWATNQLAIDIPKRLLELARAPSLFNKSSITQVKASPYGSDKTKLSCGSHYSSSQPASRS